MVLRLSSNIIGNTDNYINFPHKLPFVNRQVANLRKAFVNNSSVNIKLSKAQLSKIVQLGGFLGRLLGRLVSTGLLLMKNVIQPLAISVLIPLGITVAASASDAEIHNKILDSGTTTLTTSNEEMEDIMKIIKSIEDSGISLKGVTETIRNKNKNKKEDFLVCY